jgi:hypothetical protein
MALPERLYKYHSMDMQTLKNLKSREIYLGPPSGFNDPYDCCIAPVLGKLSGEEAVGMREFILERSLPALKEQFKDSPEMLQRALDFQRNGLGEEESAHIEESIKKNAGTITISREESLEIIRDSLGPEEFALREESFEDLVQEISIPLEMVFERLAHGFTAEAGLFIYEQVRRSLLHAIVMERRKRIGVTCFSEVRDNLLMWAHYGDKYRGICLEFSTNWMPQQITYPVRYEESYPTVSFDESLPGGDGSRFMETHFCTKSRDWKYEEEWRIIAPKEQSIAYSARDLTGIYFGPDIDQQSIELVCHIVQGQKEDLRFWKGSISNTKFHVEFEEITYDTLSSAV